MLMYASPTHEFKKSMFVVHTFQKMQKKFCNFEKKMFQVLPSKIEEILQIE